MVTCNIQQILTIRDQKSGKGYFSCSEVETCGDHQPSLVIIDAILLSELFSNLLILGVIPIYECHAEQCTNC